MKHKRLVAGVLSLALACTILSPLQLAFAEASGIGSDDGGNPSETKGLELSKTAVANGDGTYTIKLEAYATGSSITSVVSKDIPTDIVLVLDQSGSMADPIGTVSFKQYTSTQNSYYYEQRHNGGDANLYYSLSDGTYAAVSVDRNEAKETRTLISEKGAKSRYSNKGLYYYYYYYSLYAKVNGELQKITIEWSYNRGYSYTLPDGTPATARGSNNNNDYGHPTFQYDIYTVSIDDSNATYTYTYVDAEGDTKTIGTSTGADTPFTDATLYRRVVNENDGGSRLKALKKAVTTFANSVAEKAKGADGLYNTEDDVDHRIAVVGFASGNPSNTLYLNSEVFVGAQQYQYNKTASQHYSDALQSMNKEEGRNNIAASIGALASNGATYTNLGIEMANGVLGANPLQENEKRNRVVVVFTDGIPGRTGWDEDVANAAITQADITKNEYKATVYTVGIFSGADATSAGNQNSNDDTQKANWFMQKLSSNNGTPQTPSYYLSAADADTLEKIFEQISQQINSSTSSTTLDEQAIIQDVIAPAFELPTGVGDIACQVYDYIGTDVTNENAWILNQTASDLVMPSVGNTVNGERTVNVTGFDYAYNWVGTATNNGVPSYRGQKLVISFNVKPKSGFLGGNNVYTNTEACVYENSTAQEPLFKFNRPQVNVPIRDVTVTAEEKNVYLYGSVTAEELKNGATVKVGNGNVELQLDKDNFGLESWQNEYVNITVSVKDQNGNVVSDSLSNLTDDQTYTIEVTVSPKTPDTGASGTPAGGTPAVRKDGIGSAKINVFKPELTFGDSEVYYGDTVPTDFSENLVSTVWKHGGTTDTGVTMIGTAPTLDFVYTPDSSKIADGKINTKEDIGVDVTVKIGDIDVTNKTTFQHTNCEGKTCTVPDGKEFLLHVKTCQLTVTKSGGASDEPYVFDIYKDGVKYSEVTIKGDDSKTIYELPVGSYTIQEDTGWSWRYSANNGSEAVLSATDPEGTITCTNTKSKNYWLNGYSDVVTNVYGSSKTAG